MSIEEISALRRADLKSIFTARPGSKAVIVESGSESLEISADAVTLLLNILLPGLLLWETKTVMLGSSAGQSATSSIPNTDTDCYENTNIHTTPKF